MSKRVLYLMRYPLGIDGGIKIKFHGQMNSLIKLGYKVDYIAFDDSGFYLMSEDQTVLLRKVAIKNFNFYYHTLFFMDLCKSAFKIVEPDVYDFIYVRSMPLGVGGYRLFKKIARHKIPLIVEIPTYIAGGKEKHKNLIRGIAGTYFDWLNKLSAKYVTLFALIGDKADTYRKRPAINIANGIDVDSCPIRNPIFDPDTIHLVSVSSMAYWHGYDRLIKGLANYKEKDFKVIYHVIGNGVMNEPWEELAKQLGVADKVIFHGAMFGEELYSFLDKCDIGFGALGLYLKNLDVSTELKVKEYMAFGLPFVYTAVDPMIDPDLEYCLHIPNDESIVDIDSIISFAVAMRSDNSVVDTMRSYATAYLTWERQWERIVKALEYV